MDFFKGVLLPWAIWLRFDKKQKVSLTFQGKLAAAPLISPSYHSYNVGLQQQIKALHLSLGKPEIVSHEGPVDGQVRCVAEGFPAPQITWYYCEQPYARSVLTHKSEALIGFDLWQIWSST